MFQCGGGRHESFGEAILGEALVRRLGLDDRGLAIFREEVELAFGEDRAGGVLPAQTLLPMAFPGLRIEATGDAGIVDHEQQVPVDQIPGPFRHTFVILPGDVGAGHIAMQLLGLDCQHVVAAFGVEVEQVVGQQRPHRGVHAPMPHMPDLLARERVVRGGVTRERADEFIAIVQAEHRRRAVGFFGVAIVGAEVHAAITSPESLAGQLVDGGEVLHVDAIKRENQCLPKQHGGRTGPTVMVAFKIGARPDDLIGFDIDTAGAGAAKVSVEMRAIKHGGGAGVAVERVAVGWGFRFVEREVGENLSGGPVDGQQRQTFAIFGRVGHPDAVAANDRRRPGLARDGGLPGDVRVGTEFNGETRGGGVAIPRRSAKLGPGVRVVCLGSNSDPQDATNRKQLKGQTQPARAHLEVSKV